MRIQMLGPLLYGEDGAVYLPSNVSLERAHDEFVTYLIEDEVMLPPLVKLEPEDLPQNVGPSPTPHLVSRLSVIGWDEIWLLDGYALRVHREVGSLTEPLSIEEEALEIAAAFRERDEYFRHLVFANAGRSAANSQRESIPPDVRTFVWQRDAGQCVQCGSHERLEFDHIIPLAKGGSNTERNLQLLCEPCNRKKSADI